MRYLTIFLLMLFATTSAFAAAFPTNTSTKTLDLDTLSEDWLDFRFKWYSFEDQSVTFTIEQSDVGLDVSSWLGQFRVVGAPAGGTNETLLLINTNSITMTTSNMSFTVAYTNIPRTGVHQATLMLLLNPGTNSTRVLGRGTVAIKRSNY